MQNTQVPGYNNITPENIQPQPYADYGQQPPLPQQPVSATQNGPMSPPSIQKKNKIPLIVGLTSAIAVIIVAAIIVVIINVLSTGDTVVGNWKCKGFDGTGESEEYKTRLQLNKDGTFVYGAYDNLKDNHYAGTYAVEDLHKENFTGDYKYYLIEFGKTTEYIYDGKAQDTTDRQMSKMEMGITQVGGKKSAITMFYSNYNMYYCYAE